MKKLLAVLAGAAVALAIAAPAASAAPLPTNPSASPATFYPIVSDGYLDSTSVNWSGPTETNITVYDANTGLEAGSLAEVFGTQYTWDGQGGANLNEATLPAGPYEFCVVSVNDAPVLVTWDGETPIFNGDYCTQTTVGRIDTYTWVQYGKPGTHFYRKDGTCQTWRATNKVLGIGCDQDDQISLVYRNHQPALGIGQTINDTYCSANSVRFAGGGTTDLTNLSGGRCVFGVDGHWNGRLRSVHKHYEIHTDL